MTLRLVMDAAMVTVDLAHARCHLSEGLDRVEQGEPFVITPLLLGESASDASVLSDG